MNSYEYGWLNIITSVSQEDVSGEIGFLPQTASEGVLAQLLLQWEV